MRNIIHVSIISYMAPAEIKLVLVKVNVVASQNPHCLFQLILDFLTLFTKAIERLIDTVDA